MSWSVNLRGLQGDLQVDIAFGAEEAALLIIGPNGAGKTTLLRAIAGARTNFRGRVTLKERVLMDTEAGIDLAPEERRIAYVPQGFGLFPRMTVLENVAFGCERGRAGREKALGELERFEASDLAHRLPRELSAGEKQRVALARALAPGPDALLLDEPLAAMDPGTRRRMRNQLARYLRDLRLPVLTVTHDVRDVNALGAAIVVLEEGRVRGRGTANELARDTGDDFIAEFFQT